MALLRRTHDTDLGVRGLHRLLRDGTTRNCRYGEQPGTQQPLWLFTPTGRASLIIMQLLWSLSGSSLHLRKAISPRARTPTSSTPSHMPGKLGRDFNLRAVSVRTLIAIVWRSVLCPFIAKLAESWCGGAVLPSLPSCGCHGLWPPSDQGRPGLHTLATPKCVAFCQFRCVLRNILLLERLRIRIMGFLFAPVALLAIDGWCVIGSVNLPR